MFEWLTQNQYFIISMQVLVTMLIVPIMSSRLLTSITFNYGLKTFPDASAELKAFLVSAKKVFWTLVVFIFCFSCALVIHAMVNNTELLNWDNQSGLMVLYLLSMLPIITMSLMHRRLFKVLKAYSGSKRTASLRPRLLKDFVSRPLLAMIVAANLLFVITVLYFVQHPFDGFAGYANLVGLIVLDILFTVIIVVVFKDNKSGAFAKPEQRDAFKRKAIHINMLILALALFHISLSIWVAGTDLREYKLLTQSLFLQLVLVITAATLTLPKEMFQTDTIA
ncbi:hypothetical protein [Agaribacter marinus]|uniref:Uncharacterized protein n=1 Tax=Agaribacter marinus TaxID=1431249 RepID=A0AA37SW36_9ALTE|nr:hypothetical protein [Agaribacter marinus]GLR70572.1 hypothetical protein GCM10007852_14800 [Agaribacter marinus]